MSTEAEDNPIEVWIILASLFDKFDDIYVYYLEKNIHEIYPTNFDRVELYLAELKTSNENLNNFGKYYKTADNIIILV